MKTVYFILFIISRFSGDGQNYIDYYNIANEAEFLVDNGDLNKAGQLLHFLEDKYKFLKPKDYFYFGIIKYIEKDSVQGFNYFFKCIQNFGKPTVYLKGFKSSVMISDAAWVRLKDAESKNLQLVDKSVKDTLSYFFNQDQLNRNGKYILNAEYDKQLQNQFLLWMKKNGFPNIYLYGDAFWIILLHLKDAATYESYRTFLYSELTRGHIYPYYYASMVDRWECESKQVNLYDAYSIGCTKNEKIKQITKHRREIGLSIYYYGPCIFPHKKSRIGQ